MDWENSLEYYLGVGDILSISLSSKNQARENPTYNLVFVFKLNIPRGDSEINAESSELSDKYTYESAKSNDEMLF